MKATDFEKKPSVLNNGSGNQELIQAVASAIADVVPLQQDWKVLDYGCGSGGLSARLREKVGGIVAADLSAGKIAEARRALDSAGISGVETVQLDLTREAPPRHWPIFDLVIASMCLHCVKDIPRLNRAFAGIMAANGWLAIADLHLEDGSFHNDPNIPHLGFDPDVLADELAAVGFCSPSWRTIYLAQNGDRQYPIFLLTLRRTGVAQQPY